MYIYCLKLSENKYYIGKTENYRNRLSEHINKKGSKWTKIYKPIEIIFVFKTNNLNDENKYTILYMLKYGSKNVRGGSYCNSKEDYSDITLPYEMQIDLIPEKSIIKNLSVIEFLKNNI